MLEDNVEVNFNTVSYNDISKKWNVSEYRLDNELLDILKILLIDRTTSNVKYTKNIIWANNNYVEEYDSRYAETNHITIDLITGARQKIILPRALKNIELQKSRTKTNAEVFTPMWIVKKQNDEIDKSYEQDDIETYTRRKWLEITCGEAPYMATRYDMTNGIGIDIYERVGFVDRKLIRINKEIEDKAEWQRLVEIAYKSCYGFEWNGDSLLLARENLLYTYIDYYIEKWGEMPTIGLLEEIAIIISYNIFQMDGLKYIIPLSEKKVKVEDEQLSFFEEEQVEKWEITPGKRVKIMNWDTNKMEFFDKSLK